MRCYFCDSVEIVITDAPAGRVIMCLECNANHYELDDNPVSH